MNDRIRSLKVFLTPALLGLSACSSGSALLTGHFEGTLIQPTPSTGLQKSAVGGELSRVGKTAMQLTLNANGKALGIIQARMGHSHQLILSVEGTDLTEVPLSRSGKNCFATKKNFDIMLCQHKSSLTLEANTTGGAPLYSLHLDYFGDIPREVPLETPQSFTLGEAIRRALKMEFNTRIEFEHVMQARDTAKNAHANLIPHLGFASAFALATQPLNLGTILSVAGDLAPFLFPSRWIEAKESNYLSSAEKKALALARGAAALQVETIAYTLTNDRQVDQAYTDAMKKTQAIHDLSVAFEAQGKLPAGTTDHISSLYAKMNDEQGDVELAIRADLVSMSQALGFMNPNAVTDIAIPADLVPIASSSPVQTTDLEQKVLSRSIEVLQQDDLIQAAELGVKDTSFAWIDPSVDPSAELGFGLGQTVQIAKSQVNALKTGRQQITSILLQNLDGAVADFDDSLSSYSDGMNWTPLENTRIGNVMNSLQSGQNLNSEDLTTVTRDDLDAQVSLIGAFTEFRVNRARLDRMLLQNAYEDLEGTENPN